MKLALLLSLFIFTSLDIFAKDFSLIIHKPFNAALFGVTEDYDRTISAVGFSNNYKQANQNHSTYNNAFDYLASVSNRYGSQISLIKINQKAKKLLNKNITLKEFSKAVALQKTATNGYFIAGYTMQGQLLLVKLDADGNLLYFKKFGTKNFDKMNTLTQLRDGGVVAVGFSVTSRDTHDNLFRMGLGGDDIFITRFNKNGKMLWSKKYGTVHDDRGVSATEADDGSLLILGTTEYKNKRDITLIRLTENGDTIWFKEFNSTQPLQAHKIIKLRDGNFLLSLATNNNYNKEQVHLIKFDLYKNIIKDKIISTNYATVLNDIAEFSNGKLIGVGYVKEKFNTDGVAMIFDTDLKLLTQEHYGDKNYDSFNALHILHNSQVAVVGLHTDNNSQEENMWIVKLNQDATMAQIALPSNSFYKELCRLFREEIERKEIAIREDLTISLIDKNLYFKVGAYKLTQKQKQFLTQFSKKLLPFLKLHQKEVALLEIEGHTSSEWQKNNFENRYIKNENLSLKRAYQTLKFIFMHQKAPMQHYLTTILKGSGTSYKDKIMLNAKEDKTKSRRVSFKILLR
ncbi:hypothetical protein MNB_SM-5-1524 [hydrothermal vent metagenome]|uniref:OmpA-like domain-containing protein n=1 Tax=hydrothermal vent metagenome TaxID=652676 RepID=A0A1W1CYM2_9ZZZZ